MESKRKKTLFNVIMVVLILVIAGCGVMAVGNLKGWFDKGSDSVLMTKNVKGVANIQRNGVGYGLEKNVALRAGDILETKNGTTAELSAGENNTLSLNANTKLTAESVEKNNLTCLLKGFNELKETEIEKLIYYLDNNVEFYHKFLSEFDERERTSEIFNKLPIIDKKQIFNNYKQFVCKSIEHQG